MLRNSRIVLVCLVLFYFSFLGKLDIKIKSFIKSQDTNSDEIVNQYLKNIRAFLISSNTSELEVKLLEKINEAIKLNRSFSSFVQVLPRYDKTSYKELIKVSWFSYDEYSKWPTPPASLSKFKRAFQLNERKLLDELIEMAFYFFAKHEIEFMISDGTLIGSMRHFDQIPWDDDFDLIVHLRDRDVFSKLIKNQTVFSDCALTDLPFTIKIYKKGSLRAGNRPWNFPFIDIFPSDENATHLNREFYGSYYNASKKSIYPLVLRPIGKYWLPAPKDSETVLIQSRVRNLYRDCFSGKWSHREENPREADTINCKNLTAYFPFAFKVCKTIESSNVCMESLKLMNQTVYLFYFDHRPVTVVF